LVSGVDELSTFLRACLDDDERVAREALHEDAVRPGEWMTEHHGMDPEAPMTCHIAEDRAGHYWSVAHKVYIPNAEHIARWDPARVLAEVEAKRRILDLAAELQEREGRYADDFIRALAQPYAGRPGWREEWAA
jgi:hypothetical protein